MGLPSASMYDCISPLIDALFCCYNATILAYGQIGFEKTHIMGTNYTKGSSGGIIPRVIENIFEKVRGTKENTKFQISVSFIEIREIVNGGTTLAGLTGAEVTTKEEMISYSIRGSLSRATGSTNMNTQSSHSHIIFTINLEQDIGDDILCSKFHLVDLAGSKQAKRAGSDGMHFKESNLKYYDA
ncbi:hypothetical protein FNV43_RR01008 [Rhamnella rubrinervis]|uniref:Kinesin motor domain-containing protein n=1 Tax=Rhamnella rubrinervis TaxID=2594499 RepID=A0A8K0HRP9_9ROSA|nr:hypothetical protein FNV43_RR01008 [Rhamnella rubrinervis]